MPNGINRVTVIGAGTMGAAIAGQLANAGVAVTLLDMAPGELTALETAAGLSPADRKVRNRIVQAGFERMVKARPASLYLPEVAERIRLGNLEDDFDAAVAQSDWIVEAIVERPGPKQALMARIEAAGTRAIVSTNTSGIPIHMILEGRGAEFKRRFVGTHFFNPPRYLHLLEIIPTGDTAQEVVERLQGLAEDVLGKGVVVCKDTPNFVANRMFTFIQCDLLDYATRGGYSVEEVDRLTGPLLGRPKTGTFRLNDVVGIDVLGLVGDNLYDLIPNDEQREILRAEAGNAVLRTLLANNLLGSKTGQGFYKTVIGKRGEKSFWGLDLQAAAQGKVEYVEPEKPRWASVGRARDLPLAERLRVLVDADDRAGEFVWYTISRTLAYASRRVPEIAESIVDIDNAMRWGFAWEMGPFEIWDALGVQESVARMEGEGTVVAPWVHRMLEQGNTRFYGYHGGERTAYEPQSGSYVPIVVSERVVSLPEIRHRSGRALRQNDSASLHAMGDGVLLLEFHTKVNALDIGIFEVVQDAIERLHGDATGLVIGNEGAHFSAGANLVALGVAAESGQWGEVERMLRGGQDAFMGLRRVPKPVVAAPFNSVLGGGVEVCLAADRIVAHAETYMGLVEAGVGIIPGWGGCKEMVRRRVSPHMRATNVNPTPYLRQVFELIGFAKVSSSAHEARAFGFLEKEDRIVMNRDHLLATAKEEVLRMVDNGYAPTTTCGNVFASGKDMLASINVEVYSLLQGGYISEHDATIARWLGYVLCGGELSAPAWMDEQYFLDLEREAILSLAGEAKSQERIQYFLQNGRPLRN